jgi:oligopeptide transport system substrate-binding protein
MRAAPLIVFKALVCAMAVGLIESGCSKRTESTASASARVLRLSQRNEPADLDPATATLPDEFFVIRALSEGLLTPEPTGGTPRAAVAERYDVSPDGLTYTFHLRAAKWSNGEPVTAADFVSSYRRLLTPATAAPKADLFFAVKNARAFATGQTKDFAAVGFTATDDHTLVITLDAPSPRFLHYVASGPWIPVNPRVVAQHQRQWTAPGHFVGNGPFTLTEWRAQQRIVVRKNPGYYAADKIKVDEVQFLRFDSGDSEERAYRAGQLDVTLGIPQTKIATYAQERPGELHRTPLAETRFLSFNVNRPALQDERIRRALSLAIDRQRIVDRVTLGGQEPATRFLATELHSGVASPAASVLHAYNPEEARRLLVAAGYSAGKEFPHLELSAWSASQTPVLEAIQEMWRRELGVNVTLAIHEAKVHLAALNAGNYDIAFVTTIIDVADAAAILDDFTAGAANNFPHWRSDAFDRLIATAKTQRDERAQAAPLAEAESLLLEAAPVAPIYFNAKNWLMAPRVRGWQEDAVWTRFYQNVSLDEK